MSSSLGGTPGCRRCARRTPRRGASYGRPARVRPRLDRPGRPPTTSASPSRPPRSRAGLAVVAVGLLPEERVEGGAGPARARARRGPRCGRRAEPVAEIPLLLVGDALGLGLAVPDIDDDSARLRVEACGICGSDAEQYAGVLPVRLPVVPGHEPLGVIERIGDRAAKRWSVNVGDRVAVESIIRCGHCRACIAGRYQLCRGRGGLFGHGYVPLDRPPGLWGAYADYMYLDPLSIVHRVREDIPASLAVMFNPLGAGFRWAVEIPATGPGDSVLVLGPGQRGLASVVAARAAGADTIIVTGLSR